MKKSEIKNGALIQLRNGDICLKIDNNLINLEHDDYVNIKDYNNNLEYKFSNKKLDIMKIYNHKYMSSSDGYWLYKHKQDILWTWERKEESKSVEILTPEEKEFLQTVIKLYGDKIKTIFVNGQCIYLKNAIALFSKLNYEILGLKFENVENYKEYTLKELGL